MAPTCFGSGSPAAPGGGAIIIKTTGGLILDGFISANGESSPFWPGGGDGGSVYIITDIFSGSGSIYANGGDGAIDVGPIGVGGNGGRIAIYYDSLSFNKENIKCKGGANAGQPGTIVINGEPR